MDKINKALQYTILFLIRLYRYTISPLLGERCRFYPSCSEYANDAIQHYGVIKGIILTIKRLARCHPWCAGGVDLLPTKKINKG